jgi:hypothetical protein
VILYQHVEQNNDKKNGGLFSFYPGKNQQDTFDNLYIYISLSYPQYTFKIEVLLIAADLQHSQSVFNVSTNLFVTN